MKRTPVLAAIAMTLTACATTPVNSLTAGPYPDDYKAIAADYVRSTFKDPGSVRDAGISDPSPGWIGGTVGWFTCLAANAKNSYGGYTGQQTTVLLIRDGKVVDSADGALGRMCFGRRTYPFPEIETRP